MHYRAVIVGCFFFCTSLFADECGEGVSLLHFHTHEAAREDPRFQSSHISAEELERLFDSLGFPNHPNLNSVIEKYRELKGQESVDKGTRKKQDQILATMDQTAAFELFSKLDPEVLLKISGSERLLQEFVLPILFSGVEQFIPGFNERPLLVWDIGTGVGITPGVLGHVFPEGSYFVLSDFSKRLGRVLWEDSVFVKRAMRGIPFRYLHHDVVKDPISKARFQHRFGDKKVVSPDVVTALHSVGQNSNYSQFSLFLERLHPHLRKHTLLVIEIYDRHVAFSGQAYPGQVRRNPFFRMIVDRGFVPIREVPFSELGYGVFLFGFQLDMDELYYGWLEHQYASGT